MKSGNQAVFTIGTFYYLKSERNKCKIEILRKDTFSQKESLSLLLNLPPKKVNTMDKKCSGLQLLL